MESSETLAPSQPSTPGDVGQQPAVKPARPIRRGPPRSAQFSSGHSSSSVDDASSQGRNRRRGGRGRGPHRSDHPLDGPHAQEQPHQQQPQHHQGRRHHETKAPKFVYGGTIGEADQELRGALRAAAAAAAASTTTVHASSPSSSTPIVTEASRPAPNEKRVRNPKIKEGKTERQQSAMDAGEVEGQVRVPRAKNRNIRKRGTGNGIPSSLTSSDANVVSSPSPSPSPLATSSESTSSTSTSTNVDAKKIARARKNALWREQRKQRKLEKVKLVTSPPFVEQTTSPSASASASATPSSAPSTLSIEQGAHVVAALARKKENNRERERRGGKGKGGEKKEKQASPTDISTPSTSTPSTPVLSSAPGKQFDKRAEKEELRKQRRKERRWFSEYLSEGQVRSGLADGTLVKGVLRVNPHNRQLAYVTVEGIERDVLVETVKFRNRAFDNDIVVLRLFSGEEEVMEDEKRKERKRNKDRERNRNKGDSNSNEAAGDKKKRRQEKRQKRKEKNNKKLEAKLSATEEENSTPSTPQEEKQQYEPVEEKEKITHAGDEMNEDENAKEEVGITPSSLLSTEILSSHHVSSLTGDMEKLKLKKDEDEDGTKVKRRVGEVVAILEPNHPTEFIGYIRPAHKRGDQTSEVTIRREDKFVFFIPVDKKAPRVVVNIKEPQTKNLVRHFDEWATHLFVCKLAPAWPATADLPRGKLTENIGRAGELEVELEAILRTHGVDQSDFPPEILSSLPDPETWRISEQEVAKRKDLRNTRIFTIDPLTARDMDDAISCILEPGSDEIAEVGVHIADVTYFLAKGSPLDELAKKKATTVYVVEYSIPMLPRALSDTLCSLTPHEDRLAVSIIWRMNVKTGKLVNENEKPWIGRSIIRSCVKMDYGTAQRMIEGDFDSKTEQLKLDPEHPEHTSELVKQDVLNLDKIAKVIRKGRFERGALGLNSVKLSFVFDRSEQTNQSGGKPRLSVPTSCFSYITKDSNHLIEEFAILANEAIAQKTIEVYPENALVRHHESPREDIMGEFVEFCDKIGVKIDYSSSGALHRSIQAAADPQDPYKLQVLQFLATKASKQARYICTGTGGVVTSFHHYALCTDLYTHFTSPIRRYADVAVHRVLMAALENAPKAPLETAELESIAKNCNEKKQKSMRAQEDCDFLYLCGMLAKKALKEEAVVIGISKNNFEILLPRLGEAHLIYSEDYPEIVDQKFDSEKRVLSLGLSEDYEVGGGEEEAAGRDYLHHGTGRGEREQSNRRADRDEKERKDEKKGKKPVGKWIHLQIFSRLEVEARGEVTGTGKKLALKLRVLF